MSAASAAHRSLPRVLLRRAVIAIVLILIMVVPALVLMAATGQPAATYSALAALVGIVAVAAGGIRIGVITAVVVSLLAPIAVIAGLSPITGAALMAIMSLTVARLATFGLQKATMLVPVLLAWPMLAPVPWLPHDLIDKLNALLARHGTNLADALNNASGAADMSSSGSGDAMSHMLMDLRMSQTYLTWLIVFFFIGAIIPVLLGAVFRHKLPHPKLEEHGRRDTVPYAIVISVLTAVAVYYFLNHPKEPGGAFMIAAIIVLTQVGTDIAWKLTLERVIGTFVGVAVFIGVNAIVGETRFTEVFGLPFPLELYVIGIVFGVIAVMAKFSRNAWIYFILIVPTTAYLNAFTVGEAAGLGKARLIDNAVGAVLVILAALITLVASRIYAKRFPVGASAEVTHSPA